MVVTPSWTTVTLLLTQVWLLSCWLQTCDLGSAARPTSEHFATIVTRTGIEIGPSIGNGCRKEYHCQPRGSDNKVNISREREIAQAYLLSRREGIPI